MKSKPQSLTNRTLSGLLWMSLATGANVVVQLLVLVVLARLLTPADFGLAAVALMVVGFSAIFSDLGIGPAVVQRPDLQSSHLRVGFTCSLLLGVLVAVLTWLTAPLIAGFFRFAGLTPILRIQCLVFPIQGLAVVADSLLQREHRFRSLAAVETTAVVLGYGGVGIALAALGFGVWALVWAHLSQIVVKTVLLLLCRPHPAWPLLERRAYGELLYFGGGFTVGRLTNYLAGQGEFLVIGRCLSTAALGIYGRAYQLMAGPAVLFGNVLDRVLFPVMARVQDQPQRLAQTYRRGNALVALVIFPTSAILVALAPEVIHVLLGAEWQAAIFPLQILGVGMLFRTGSKISDALVRATGAVYRRSWRQAAYAVLVVGGAWLGHWWGVEGVAVAVLVTLAFNFFLMAHLGLRLSSMSWRTFAAAHLPGFATAVLVLVPVAATALVLRAWGVPPVVVLMSALAPVLPMAIVVCSLPARAANVFLGPDGRWMMRKLLAFYSHPAQAPSNGRTESLSRVPQVGLAAATYPNDGTDVCAALTEKHPLLGLTENLVAEGVCFCQWKGRLDVPRILSGAGDVDLLVAPRDAETFLRVLAQLKFKQVRNCFGRDAKEELHLYGPDPETGALLHLHVHFALLGPRSFLRSLAPTLEDFVLRHSSPVEIPGVLQGLPVVRPAAALVVFVLHAMEQYAHLGAYLRLTRQRKNLQRKLHALLATDATETWRPLLETWLPAIPPALFADCLAALRQPTSWWYRFRQARRLYRLSSSRGSFSAREALVRLSAFLRAGWRRLCHGRGAPKQFTSGGAVIALVGPDASGKSTMVAETKTWLGKVFRVQAAHLGKPPSTWLTLLPNLCGKLLGLVMPRLRFSRNDALTQSTTPKRRGLLYRLRAVLLAWDRRALARHLARKADRGWLVVCDRYPSPVVGAADSARLPPPEQEPGVSRLQAWLARLENRLYRDVPAPVLVIRLTAPLAIAIDRNQERQKAGKETAAYIASRHKGFIAPQFPETQVAELDTSKSRSETIQELRRLLWRSLGNQPFPVSRHPVTVPPLHNSPTIKEKNVSPFRKYGRPLVVEFIGVTGVGKSTLVATVAKRLSLQGIRVCAAEEVILARFGLAFIQRPGLRSALVHLLSLTQFCHSLFRAQGFRLWSLALRSVLKGTDSFRTRFSLLRNVLKRIGAYFLLEQLLDRARDCDVILWDEGIVHAAHNLFVHTLTQPNKEEIVRFGELVPKADCLIWVTALAAQSAGVILERGHSRVPATPDAAQAFVEHAQTVFEMLSAVESLREIIHRVDNSDRGEAGLQATAVVISDILKPYLLCCPEALPPEPSQPRSYSQPALPGTDSQSHWHLPQPTTNGCHE